MLECVCSGLLSKNILKYEWYELVYKINLIMGSICRLNSCTYGNTFVIEMLPVVPASTVVGDATLVVVVESIKTKGSQILVNLNPP